MLIANETARALGEQPPFAEIEQMIVEWNESCAYNSSLLGVPWEPPAECWQIEVPEPRPWWKFWGKP